MTLKTKIADIISNVIYKILHKRSINYHVSLKNFKKSKPDYIDVFDFSIFSLYNQKFPETLLYEKALNATRQWHHDNLSKRLRHYTLFQLLKTVLLQNAHKEHAGDVVEAGCFQGQSAYGLATILKEYSFQNKFMIFDSFEGLSDLSPEDQNEIRDLSASDIQIQKKQFFASLSLVKENLREFDFIDYYQGWIPEKFDVVKNNKFIFINIDVDLYQPVKDSLEFFYPRLCKGGIIFLDDYGMSQFPGAKIAIDEFLKTITPALFMYFPFGGGFIQK